MFGFSGRHKVVKSAEEAYKKKNYTASKERNSFFDQEKLDSINCNGFLAHYVTFKLMC